MGETFALEGFYNYSLAPKGKGNLTGELEIDKDGLFEAIIKDHSSRNPEKEIKGYLKHAGKFDNLNFFKFPPNSSFANLIYSLRKESNGSFEGKYKGIWGALPYKTVFTPEYNLFIVRMDPSIYNVKDTAQINLTKR